MCIHRSQFCTEAWAPSGSVDMGVLGNPLNCKEFAGRLDLSYDCQIYHQTFECGITDHHRSSQITILPCPFGPEQWWTLAVQGHWEVQ